jgi:DNA polymerase-3 subunit epsilon
VHGTFRAHPLRQKDEARRYLERCIDDPGSDEEWLFARDFYERKFGSKRTSVVTDVLRAAETIDIDEAQSGSPERAAASYFEQAGHRAFRVENALWRTFFGLYFWDELFAGDAADLHSPFEFVPRNLTTGTFYDDNRAAIEQKLAMLDEPNSVVRAVLRSSTAHYGKPNGVFRWRRSVIDALFALLESGRGDPLREILTRFCRDYEGSRYGYPDLLVLDDSGARFIEVKTEGDQTSCGFAGRWTPNRNTWSWTWRRPAGAANFTGLPRSGRSRFVMVRSSGASQHL